MMCLSRSCFCRWEKVLNSVTAFAGLCTASKPPSFEGCSNGFLLQLALELLKNLFCHELGVSGSARRCCELTNHTHSTSARLFTLSFPVSRLGVGVAAALLMDGAFLLTLTKRLAQITFSSSAMDPHSLAKSPSSTMVLVVAESLTAVSSSPVSPL